MKTTFLELLGTPTVADDGIGTMLFTAIVMCGSTTQIGACVGQEEQP